MLQPTGVVSTTLPATAVKLAHGGLVTVAVPYLPSNFNPSAPAGANRVTQMVMQDVWPQSFVIDPQYTAETTGFLDSAELISLSPETIQYQIDPGAKWSDGAPITVTDFIYNWHEQLLHASVSPDPGVLAGYAAIGSVTGSPDGRTVTVVFKTPYADWEGLWRNIVPAHIGERIGWDGFGTGEVADVVSGGAFEIGSFTPGQELVLKRNPGWWGPNPPHLDEIVFKVVPPGAATWAALKSGEVQVAEVASSPSDDLQAALADLDTTTTLSPVLWQLCFNLTDAVVAQPELRQAIADATDRTELVADTIGLDDPGIPVAQNRVFLVDSPGYDGHPGQYNSVDIAAGQRLLEGAGYVLGADGYFSLLGHPLLLTLSIPSGNATALSLAQVFGAQMKDLGVQVRFKAVKLASLVDSVMPAGTYQLALAPFVGSPYQSWTQPLYNQVVAGATGSGRGAGLAGAGTGGLSPAAALPSAAGSGGPVGPTYVSSDLTGLSDPAISTLYQQAASQLDLPTARGLYNEIDSLLWQDLPTLPLFEMPVTLVTAHDLVNVSESFTTAGVMWNAADWAIALNLPAITPPTG